MKKAIALIAVFCCVALAQTSAFCACDCDDKGCGCNEPPKKVQVEDKGCGCNKPNPPEEIVEESE